MDPLNIIALPTASTRESTVCVGRRPYAEANGRARTIGSSSKCSSWHNTVAAPYGEGRGALRARPGDAPGENRRDGGFQGIEPRSSPDRPVGSPCGGDLDRARTA